MAYKMSDPRYKNGFPEQCQHGKSLMEHYIQRAQIINGEMG